MNKLFFIAVTLISLNLFFSCANTQAPDASLAIPFDSASCFIPNGMEMCTPHCQEIIVDAHKISDQQSTLATLGISTIPFVISTPALIDSIGGRTCNDNWRIKLDTFQHQVTFQIQDSANAPGYFSSALITGILNDNSIGKENPIEFNFYEARDNNDSLHFIFNVLYPGERNQYFNVSDLPTSHL